MSAALPLVAGQASATATSTPANGAAPASMAMAPAAATSMPGGPQLASAGIQPKIFPVPPRNGPASPSVALPPPTTGPGALPGGKSLALSAQEMNGQQGEQNFYTSYAQALDKYRAMQQMKGGAAPVTPLAPSAAPAPTMLQPAAAMAPAADADEDATTVH